MRTVKTFNKVKNPDVVYWKKVIKNFFFLNSIVVRSSGKTTTHFPQM